jgi:hypothetical protein
MRLAMTKLMLVAIRVARTAGPTRYRLRCRRTALRLNRRVETGLI